MIATTEQLAANAATDDPQTDIETFLTLLHGGGGFELRSYACPTKPGSDYTRVASGYFTDCSSAANYIRQIERRKPPGTYTTLNPVIASVMGRSFNAINWQSNKTTDDNEIARVRNILADVDPHRDSGTSSTDAEMHRALEITEIIVDGLTAIGLPTPKMQGMSGNGASLIFGADIAVEDNHLVVAMLKFLSDHHADELARGPVQLLDQSTSSISQLTKVLGTWARKGSSTPDIVTPDSVSDPRPHRQSWYRTFDEPGVVTAEMLRDILPTKYIDDAKKKADTPTKANRPVARPRDAPVAKPIKHSGGYDDSKHYASVVLDACVGRCRDVIAALTTITPDHLDQHGTDKPCPNCGGNSRFYVCKHGGGIDEHGQVHCRRCMGGATANVIDTIRRFGDFDQTPAGYWRACDAIAEYLGLEVYDGDDFDADPLADIKAQEALTEAESETDEGASSKASASAPGKTSAAAADMLYDCELTLVLADPEFFRFRCLSISESWCELKEWPISLPAVKRQYLKQVHRPLPYAVCKKWPKLLDRLPKEGVMNIERPDAAEDYACVIAETILRRLESVQEWASLEEVFNHSASAHPAAKVKGDWFIRVEGLFTCLCEIYRMHELTRKRLSKVLRMCGADSQIMNVGSSRARLWRVTPEMVKKLEQIAVGDY